MHENGAQHGSQLFAKLGFKELVRMKSDKVTSCKSAWSFFIGGNMSKGRIKITIVLTLILTMMLPILSYAETGRTEKIVLVSDDMGYSDLTIDNVFSKRTQFPGNKQTYSWEQGDDVHITMISHFSLSETQRALIESADSYVVSVECINNEYPAGGLWTYYASGEVQKFRYYVELRDINGPTWILKSSTDNSYGSFNYGTGLTDITLNNEGVPLDELYLEWWLDMVEPSTTNVEWRWRCTQIILTIECKYNDSSVPSAIYTQYGVQEIVNQNNQIINQSPSDKEISDNLQNNVANKQEQSDQLLEDSKVDKPIVSDEVLNPMDKVDDDALDSMGGMIGAVFVSPTLGSIALLTLTFAFLGFILYGKR